MAGTLGCTAGYTAVIVAKDTGIPLGELSMSDLRFERELDAVSEASLRIPIGGSDCASCEVLQLINPWHHELILFRDGEYVWSGIVINIRANRDEAVLTARDLFQLLHYRIIHENHCFSTECGEDVADLTVLGQTIIDDAFQVDGHNYEIQIFNQVGLDGERLYEAGENALTALEEALRLGLDATVLGRKIILGAVPFGATAMLTDEDFQQGLEWEIDGLSTATRAITISKGFVGVATAPGADAAGVHPYYGLLEFVSLDRQELTTQQLANEGAQAIIDGAFPPPTILTAPTGARLSPNAPVTINELIPGVRIPVVATQLCRPIQGNFILLRLEVNWSREIQEEIVTLTMSSPSAANSGTPTSRSPGSGT
jgi:hypothetical protein